MLFLALYPKLVKYKGAKNFIQIIQVSSVVIKVIHGTAFHNLDCVYLGGSVGTCVGIFCPAYAPNRDWRFLGGRIRPETSGRLVGARINLNLYGNKVGAGRRICRKLAV